MKKTKSDCRNLEFEYPYSRKVLKVIIKLIPTLKEKKKIYKIILII